MEIDLISSVKMAVSGKQTDSLTLAMGSDEDLKIFCNPCDRDGPRIPAQGYCVDCNEHLCEPCFNHHKKATPSRHHVLLGKDRMPKSPQTTSTTVTASLGQSAGGLTTPCAKHQNEVIKYYCHVHCKLLCNVCVTLEHTVASCNVDYIPDISGVIVDSQEYDDVLKSIDIFADYCQNLSPEMNKQVKKSEASLADVLSDVKEFRKKIDQKLDTMERAVEDAVKALQKKNKDKSKTVESTTSDLTKSLKVSSDSIKQLNKSKQADKLFIEMKLTEDLIKEQKGYLDKIARAEHYNFKPNQSISSVIQSENTLGAVTYTGQKNHHPPLQVVTSNIKPRSPAHLGEVCVETSKDRDNCWITGMQVLTPDCVVAIDYYNRSVKLIDLNSLSISDQLVLDSRPWDVCHLHGYKLAVTLPSSEKIQFISFSSDKLSFEDTLRVHGKCHGVGVGLNQRKLAVSFQSPAKLQIRSWNGTVETESGKDLLYPDHLTTSPGAIYVSDVLKHTVTKFNWQGQMTGTYKSGLWSPRCLAVTDLGTVFVCDSEERNIQEISADASDGRVQIEDLDQPYGICWCCTNKTLFVSSSKTGRASGSIQIYKL